VILFVSDRDGNPEIYVLDDAGQIKRMTDNPSTDIQPAWEPGLQRVSFTTNRDSQNEIYLMNADGTNPVDLTNNPADDQQPAWSVDGEWVAFTSNRDGNYEIYITKPGTLELYNLTNHPSQDQVSDWR
jgi:Tol biopolymer transport system component